MESKNQYVWYACEEHIDIVIDEIVDRFSTAPAIDWFTTGDDEERTGCSWCGGIPRYQLEIDAEGEND